jgi:heme oxygenase
MQIEPKNLYGVTDAGTPPIQAKRDGARGLMRCTLRDATRSDHQQIDQALSRLKLADPGGYGVFLSIHLNALSSLSTLWRPEDQADFAGLLCCLSDDLRELGCAHNVPEMTQATKSQSLRPWGVGYVIRGSRLGAAMLRQRVPAACPTSFLDFMPILTWPDFLKQLDREHLFMKPPAKTQTIRGAKQAFAAFAAAVTRAGLHNE